MAAPMARGWATPGPPIAGMRAAVRRLFNPALLSKRSVIRDSNSAPACESFDHQRKKLAEYVPKWAQSSSAFHPNCVAHLKSMAAAAAMATDKKNYTRPKVRMSICSSYLASSHWLCSRWESRQPGFQSSLVTPSFARQLGNRDSDMGKSSI